MSSKTTSDKIEDDILLAEKVVYHYCDLSTAIKILENSKLWATHVSYLNDSSELQYGFQSIKRAVETYAGSHSSDRVAALVLEHFTKLPEYPYFVTSFSNSRDKLSQWRSYADDGRGCAIGFRAFGLGHIDGPFEQICAAVNYNNDFDVFVHRLLDTYASHKHTWSSPASDELKEFSFQQSANFVFDKLTDAAILRKHPDFAEEDEWRWFSSYKLIPPETEHDDCDTVRTADADVGHDRDIFEDTLADLQHEFLGRLRYRVGRLGLTPYIELDFSSTKWCICEIMLGPRVNKSLAVPVLEMLCRSQGYQFRVNHSEIPYR